MKSERKYCRTNDEKETYTEAMSTTIETVCRSSSHLLGVCSYGFDASPETVKKISLDLIEIFYWKRKRSYLEGYSSIRNLYEEKKTNRNVDNV